MEKSYYYAGHASSSKPLTDMRRQATAVQLRLCTFQIIDNGLTPPFLLFQLEAIGGKELSFPYLKGPLLPDDQVVDIVVMRPLTQNDTTASGHWVLPFEIINTGLYYDEAGLEWPINYDCCTAFFLKWPQLVQLRHLVGGRYYEAPMPGYVVQDDDNDLTDILFRSDETNAYEFYRRPPPPLKRAVNMTLGRYAVFKTKRLDRDYYYVDHVEQFTLLRP
jgi:hypothetical protein